MHEMLKSLYSISGDRKKSITKMFIYRLAHSVFVSMIIVAILYFLIRLSENAFYGKALSTVDVFIVFLIIFISVVGRISFMHLSLMNKAKAQFNISAQRRLDIGDRLKDVNMGYFSANRTGDISSGLTRVLSDFEAIGLKFIEEMIGGILQTIIMALFILPFDYITGIIVITTLLITLFINKISQPRADKINIKLHELKLKLNADILEYISGIGVVKAFGKSKERLKEIEQSINETAKAFYDEEKEFAMSSFFFTITLKLGTFVIVVSSILRYLDGSLESYKVIMIIMMSFIAFTGFDMFLTVLNIRQLALSILKTIDELQNLKIIENGNKVFVDKAGIEFKDVNFSYDEEQVLFSNLNLIIPEGKTTALVGTSGSGKTTLCNLMARFWDVDSGEVLIGGVNVKEYNYDSLLSNFTFVFQDVYLFEDTIKNNIKFGKPDATDEEIIAVAKKARCHEFISKLKEGYDTNLNEGGLNLSGGERQRLSIARAMLKDSKFVILDEVTSSVDPENEEELVSALKELLKNRTVITIAHRLATIKNAEQIIVMDKGQIIQRGSHNDLIKIGGLYKKFVELREVSNKWKI